MKDQNDEFSQWMKSLVAGESKAFEAFWQDYSPAIRSLAERRMTPALKQRVDPDDVVQSVCRTFIRRAQQNQFEFDDSNALWCLLCAVTITKVRQHARFHTRKRRSMYQEVSLNADPSGGMLAPMDREPTPDEVVAFADQVQHLLCDLNDEESKLVQLKLEGTDNQQIAKSMQCSTRSVRRLLAKIRGRWETELTQLLDQ